MEISDGEDTDTKETVLNESVIVDNSGSKDETTVHEPCKEDLSSLAGNESQYGLKDALITKGFCSIMSGTLTKFSFHS
jgi:hypothetical protein